MKTCSALPHSLCFCFRRILFVALVGWLAACGGAAQKRSLNVFAAASLTESFNAMEAPFERAHPEIDVQFNFAGSNQLRTQIEQGAPAGVFASASAKDMQGLVAGQQVDAAQVQPFARNRLIVIFPKDNLGKVQSLADLARPGLKLIVADANVPVGGYTFAMLDALSANPIYGADFRVRVERNIVSRELNVKQVAAKIRLGEGDVGVVYASDVTADLAPLVGTLAVPNEFNQIAVYPIAPTRNAANAADAALFVDYVLSSDGQAALMKAGFIGKP